MSEKGSRRRSDKVRRRIKQDSREWIDQASRRITNPNSGFSPIRSVIGSKDTNHGDHATQDRRFFRLGWRLLSFILVCGFGFCLFLALRSPMFEINAVNIVGLTRLNGEEVAQTINIIGRRIFEIDPQTLTADIQENYPELWDIHITPSLPAHVSIKAVERQPQIAWTNGATGLWIDSEGYLIPSRGEAHLSLQINANALPDYHLILEDDPDLDKNLVIDKPAIKESYDSALFFVFPKKIDHNLLTAILQLNAWMPEEETLLYQKARGIGWRDIRGWDVFIGSKLENINDKMLLYETIVRSLEAQGIQPSMVSVEFLHAPYYRLENDHG